MRSRSKRPKLCWKAGMSQARFPKEKSVEVAVTLRAYRDQAGIFGYLTGVGPRHDRP